MALAVAALTAAAPAPGAFGAASASATRGVQPAGSAHGQGARIETVVGDHPVSAISATEAGGAPDDLGATPWLAPHVEPHVAVDPDDADHLVAGAIVVAPERGEEPWHCAVFVSFDGGRGWSRHDLPMERCIDPWVTFAGSGAVVLLGIELRSDAEGSERMRLVRFDSADGGRSWSDEPEPIGRAFDHELVTADRRRDPPALWMAVQRTLETPRGRARKAVGVYRSEGGTAPFEHVDTLRPSNLGLNATGVEVLSDGTLLVSFIDFQRELDGYAQQGMLEGARAWALRSEDGGESFTEPLFITEACGMSDGFPGYPAFDVDRSERFPDRLYHLCIRPELDGLALVTSDDGGDRWSEPSRVDPVPADGPEHARTPMLAVDDSGVVAAAWYGRRHDPERRCQDLIAAVSADGGASFSAPHRVSTETSCPDAPGNGRVSRSWPMGGDYGSLAAGPDGTFHVLWADSRSGRFALRHAAFRVSEGR